MKRFLFLVTCYTMVTAFADDLPSPRDNPEEKAKEEIENFCYEGEAPWADFFNPPSDSIPSNSFQRPNLQINSESPSDVIGESFVPPPIIDLEGDDLEEPLYSPDFSIVDVFQNQSAPLSPINQLDDQSASSTEKKGYLKTTPKRIIIDLMLVFAGSPTIYALLLCLSIASFGIWVYALLSLRNGEVLPSESLKKLRQMLLDKEYDKALLLSEQSRSILLQIAASGIRSRKHDPLVMQESMKAVGRRATTPFWQKIGLLSDIAIVAPMLGLLGTVLGMFYAFYDLNRSMEGISALFDGLGISVGTTLGGLLVAIFAIIFHSTTKYRLTKQLIVIEKEAASIMSLITSQ